MVDTERFSCAAGFVRKATENGAYLYPPLKKRNRNSWERHLDITLIYYFGEQEDKNGSRSLTCKEVGEIFPISNRPLSKAGVSQIIIDTLSHLRTIYPHDFEKFFPETTLLPRIGKPAFFYDSTARNIALCIEQNKKYPELAKTYTARQLETARGKLRPFGIAVPYQNEEQSQRENLAEELAKVGPDTDITTLKRLVKLAGTPHSSHRNRSDLLKEYFIPLTILLKQAGIRIDRKAGDLDPLVLKLETEGYPVGIYSRLVKKGSQKKQLLRYLIVYKMQEEAIKKFLLA